MRPSPPISSAAFGLILGAVAIPASAATLKESLRAISTSPDFVRLAPGPNLSFDLKYAGAGNFMGRNMYGEFDKPWLHRIAAAKLAAAADSLSTAKPGFRLVVYDALRPRSVQYLLWEKVKGTPQEKYVANPVTGSIHNYGFAVDLSILDSTGRELDMGTAFDDFSQLAQPRLEERFLKEGKLAPAHAANRALLRRVMAAAGFTPLPLEWWHFDALPKAEVKRLHEIVE